MGKLYLTFNMHLKVLSISHIMSTGPIWCSACRRRFVANSLSGVSLNTIAPEYGDRSRSLLRFYTYKSTRMELYVYRLF